MVKRKPTESAPDFARRQMSWAESSDAAVSGVVDWDIKTHLLAEAVLCILGTGSGVMFGVTRDGGALAVTIYSGDEKVRKYLHDSVELDDWSDSVIGKAKSWLAKQDREKPAS